MARGFATLPTLAHVGRRRRRTRRHSQTHRRSLSLLSTPRRRRHSTLRNRTRPGRRRRRRARAIARTLHQNAIMAESCNDCTSPRHGSNRFATSKGLIPRNFSRYPSQSLGRYFECHQCPARSVCPRTTASRYIATARQIVIATERCR